MLTESIKKWTKKIINKVRSAEHVESPHQRCQKKFLREHPAYKDIVARITADKRVNFPEILNPLISNSYHGAQQASSKAAIYLEIANFLLNCGQPETAQTYFKLSLDYELTPNAYSLYLQCLLMSPSCTDEQMFIAASQYTKLFLANIPKYTTHKNNLTVKRNLKVGYLCHFFHNSVSQSLLLPFLRAHDRSVVSVYCYSDTLSHEISDDVRQVADIWRDTKTLTDKELAVMIREDEIDILLELNGHCVTNRYGVIARKPAPVQISYYNICATSGVSGFDYILVGDAVSLNKSQPFYTEIIYYLKGVAGVVSFEERFPKCAPVPSLTQPYITFGSFGAAHKVNAQVIKLWCKVLKAVPHSRFYMKAGVLSFDDYQQIYRRMFAQEGIDLSRIHLEGYSDHLTMLNYYGKVDIALDTFPGQGGTTTVEALWQGVPVITLKGDRYSMQMGSMTLTCINHPELIAHSEAEFVEKAAALAANQDQLVKLRSELRQDLANSTLADPRDFATRLEAAYADMWKKYCEASKTANSNLESLTY